MPAGGTVTDMLPAGEMGRAVPAPSPLTLAEEPEADWGMVKTAYAPPVPKIYGNPHPIWNGAVPRGRQSL
jgi:hypothetical protein